MSLNQPDPSVKACIADNVCVVRERIEAACTRAGRSADEVNLVAVTKYAALEWVRALLAIGLADFGESRPQQLVERASLLHDENLRWHLIGHLQRNKARRVLPVASMVHSVDTPRLLHSLDRLSSELDLKPRILLEVNISGEAAKNGFQQQDLIDHWRDFQQLQHLHLDGLMTMAPLTENREDIRGVFRNLRLLRDKLVENSPDSISLPNLSMGMSRDFEIAIEEGATIIRLGSILFEGLESHD